MKQMLENRQIFTPRQIPANRVIAKKVSGAKALTRGLSLLLVLPISLGMLVLTPDNKSIAPAQALVGSEDNPPEIRLAALDCLLKEDLEGAMDSYNTAIESTTRHYGQDSLYLAELYYEAGALALRMDLFDRAESYLNQAIKINPRLAMARLTLAEVSRKRERPMEALEQIQAELSDRPDSIIARQQFIRWLGANAKNPTDHSIANQESLRLLSMTSQVKYNRLKTMQSGQRPAPATARANQAGKPGAVKLPPPKVEPEFAKPQSKTEEKPETGNITKTGKESSSKDSHPKPSGGKDTTAKALPTFGFGMSKFVKDKAEKTKKLEAEKLEKEKREKVAREKAAEEAQKAAREKADRDKAERERALRERADRERRLKEKKAQKSESVKGTSNAAGKKAGETPAAPEPKASSQETKATDIKKTENKKAEESVKFDEKSSKDKKEKPKSKPVPVEEATPQTQQPQQAMPPMQPVYAPFQVMPIMSSPAPRKGKGGLVPPPPPTMPMYPGMAPPPVPMMIPNQFQQPAPRPKPKPKPVKVEEAPKEVVEDKPPPMTGGDSDPDFILDWGEVKKKKK